MNRAPEFRRLLGSQESAIVVSQAFLEAAMAVDATNGAVVVPSGAVPQPVNSQGLLS